MNSFNFTKAIWIGVIPPTMEILAWFKVTERIKTKSRLHKLGILELNQISCSLCNSQRRTVFICFLLVNIHGLCGVTGWKNGKLAGWFLMIRNVSLNLGWRCL